MHAQSNIIKNQDFQLQTKQRQIAQLDCMIAEFEQMIAKLTKQINDEGGTLATQIKHQKEHHTKNSTKQNRSFARSNLVQAACLRRDNLNVSINNLKEQRTQAQTELAELERDQQRIEKHLLQIQQKCSTVFRQNLLQAGDVEHQAIQ